MKLLEVFLEKLRPFEDWTISDKAGMIGKKVYSTGKVKGVKPYSVLILTGISFSSDGTKYILRDGENVYHLRNADNLYPYKGQDLKKQQIYDTVVLGIELAVMLAVTGVLSYYRTLVLS